MVFLCRGLTLFLLLWWRSAWSWLLWGFVSLEPVGVPAERIGFLRLRCSLSPRRLRENRFVSAARPGYL